MTTASYDVVLTGEIIPGREKDEVVAALVGIFKLAPELAAGLLQGKPRRIKTGLTETEAKRYLTTLHRAGARTRVICQGAATLQIPTRQGQQPSSDASEVISEVAKQTGETARPLVDTLDALSKVREQFETSRGGDDAAPATTTGSESVARSDSASERGSFSTAPAEAASDGANRLQQIAEQVRKSSDQAGEVAKLITETLDRIRKAAAEPASDGDQNVSAGEADDEVVNEGQISAAAGGEPASEVHSDEPTSAESEQVTDSREDSAAAPPQDGVDTFPLTETRQQHQADAAPLELVSEGEESVDNPEPESPVVEANATDALELVSEGDESLDNPEPESPTVEAYTADTLELVNESPQPTESTDLLSQQPPGTTSDTLRLANKEEQSAVGSSMASEQADTVSEAGGLEHDTLDESAESGSPFDVVAEADAQQTIAGDPEILDEDEEQAADDEGRKLAVTRRASLIATIAVAMLPPVLYTGIIAVLAYASWWHALNDMYWYQSASGMLMKSLMAGSYGLLLAAGPVLILLLLRPLTALFTTRSQGCLLDMDKHHQLQELVDHVAEFSDAPVPDEIWVNGELNVVSSARSGLVGMFSSDYVLTIGLPVFTGMGANQLAGLMAREFSYYSHRLGTLSHLVAVQTHGTYRHIIDHRDALDLRLQVEVDNRTGAVRFVLRVIAACLGLGRRVLDLMSRASSSLIRLLNRALDREADLAAASLVGVEVYRSAFLRAEELTLASDKVDAELEYLMQDGKYPDNLQPLLFRFLGELTEEERGQAEGALSVMRSLPGSIVPATARRIAAAMAFDGEAEYDLKKPASQLLVGYEFVARAYTLLYYRAQLGPDFSSDRMLRAAQVLRQADERTAGNEALEVYLPNLYLAGRHVVPATVNAQRAGVNTIKAKMAELIRELRVQLPVFEAVAGKVAVLNKQLAEARAGLMMDRVGISFDAASFGLPGQGRKAIVQFRDDCEKELQEQEAKLEKIEYLISCRMGLGIELMRRTDSGGGKIVREMDMYRSVLSGLNRAMEEMNSFQIEAFAIQAMSSRIKKSDKIDTAMAETYVKKCADSYRRLLTALKDTPYPFEHGEGISTVAKYLRKEVGSPEQLAAKPASFHTSWQRVEEILENLDRRMMLGVASWAIKVESHLGLESVRIILNKDGEPEMKEAVGQG